MKILAVFPNSIGGRLTMKSIFDGFEQIGAEVFYFDKLKDDETKLPKLCRKEKFDFLVSYDFAGIKINVDNKLKLKTINYFSDVIEDNHSGNYWVDYYEYLFKNKNYTFYWDKELFEIKKEKINNLFYQPHFVNTEIYKNFNNNPKFDIMFAGRLDTDFRLNTVLQLSETFKGKKFAWYAIEKHFYDARSRVTKKKHLKFLDTCYQGFIDNEENMAKAINNAKIFFNFNAQGISSLNYRTFQVMACERVMLSDNRSEAFELFNPDKDIVVYNDLDDLKNKINLYLSDEKLYKTTAQNARQAILNNHSSKICVERMLNCIK
ncbi:MAG: glycosyltransferase [Candidatus Gastranaerophilales bacterium]|nr:glycosyltransferase [Candidatus Gastranaerophilales bacterium]